MHESLRISRGIMFRGIGGSLLLGALFLLSSHPAAVPQWEGSTHEVRVIVTRFDNGHPEEDSPTGRLMEARESGSLPRTLTADTGILPAGGEFYLERAREKAHAGEYEASVTDLETAIEMGPSSNDSCSVFAEAIIEVLTVMRRAYNSGAEIDPSLFDTVERRLDDAVAYLDTAIELQPDNPELYISRAAAHGFLIEWSLSLQDLSRAVELNPDNYVALARRGCVNMGMDYLEDAVADLSAAIALAPDSVVYYDYRACAYRMLGEDGKAEADLDTYLELGGGNSPD